MAKGAFVGNIIFKFIFAALFISFAVSTVNAEGWTFFAYICIIFATFDVVQAINLMGIFSKAKNTFKK